MGQTHDPLYKPNSRADLPTPRTKLRPLSTEHSVHYTNQISSFTFISVCQNFISIAYPYMCLFIYKLWWLYFVRDQIFVHVQERDLERNIGMIIFLFPSFVAKINKIPKLFKIFININSKLFNFLLKWHSE